MTTNEAGIGNFAYPIILSGREWGGTRRRREEENGTKEENEKTEENKVATIFIHVKPMKPHSKTTSVGQLSHARCNGTWFCFVNSRFQNTDSLKFPSISHFLPLL
jgi:hypothetical protein